MTKAGQKPPKRGTKRGQKGTGSPDGCGVDVWGEKKLPNNDLLDAMQKSKFKF